MSAAGPLTHYATLLTIRRNSPHGAMPHSSRTRVRVAPDE